MNHANNRSSDKKEQNSKTQEIKDLNLPIETKLNPLLRDDLGLDLEQFDFQVYHGR